MPFISSQVHANQQCLLLLDLKIPIPERVKYNGEPIGEYHLG